MSSPSRSWQQSTVPQAPGSRSRRALTTAPRLTGLGPAASEILILQGWRRGRPQTLSREQVSARSDPGGRRRPCGLKRGESVAGGPGAGWGPVQAPTVARWWRWSFARLWVAISNRHSVRTADLPRRRNRVTLRLCLVLTEHRLDHRWPLSVELLADSLLSTVRMKS